MKHIRTVESIYLAILKSFPPQLSITVVGTVPTSGWKDGTLEPRYYIETPADGVQDFDFVAQPPAGIAADVVLPITAHTIMNPMPTWLKGVRIHASTNMMESLLSDGKEIPIG